MNTTNVKPKDNSESLISLNQYSFPFRIFDIYLPQYQMGSVYFLILQKDTSYVHIGSTLCLRTTLRKYSKDGYPSGTDIAMHLSPFVFIAYICGFRKDMQIIQYTKYKWIYQQNHDVLKWA